MISRRHFLLGAAATLSAASGISYAHYWEPGWLKVIYQRIPFFHSSSPSSPPFKILFLADLHYSRYVPLSLISEAITLGLAHDAYGERQIYTTRGVGSLYGLRLNCRPEVTILELV